MLESDSSIAERSFRSRYLHFILLALITLAGAALRFSFLDRPGIWGDEALTFMRVCGSFDDLLQRLSDAGFAPVHYELLWLIGQHSKLTPSVLRFVPALSGTLMIPAMYWLTRELLGRSRSARSISLLTALLTAGNAYLLNYSRDAKMYSPFWLLATINVAALLWWLRHRRRLPYWAWVASGVAMLAFDTLGAITIVIELLIVLTTARPQWRSIPRLIIAALTAAMIWFMTAGPFVGAMLLYAGAQSLFIRVICWIAVAVGSANLIRLGMTTWVWKDWKISLERKVIRPWVRWLNDRFVFPPIILFLLGLGMMAVGPIGYYAEFNQFFTHVDDRGWRATGIDWIGRMNRGRGPMELVGSTASAFLTAWEWPRESDRVDINIRTARLLDGSVIAIAALLALGLLPWRSKRLFADADLSGPGPTNRFRTTLWMTAWLVLPPYGFYCVCFKDRVSPAVWFESSWQFLAMHRWSWPLAIGVALWCVWHAGFSWRMRMGTIVRTLAAVFVITALAELIYRKYPALDEALAKNSAGWRMHDSVWVSRYIAVILQPVLIGVATLLWRLPTRPFRWLAIGFFLVVNLSQFGVRLFAGSEPPTALLAQDLIDSHTQRITEHFGSLERSENTRTYYSANAQNFSEPGPGGAPMFSSTFRYYLSLLSGVRFDDLRPHTPDNPFPILPASRWVDFNTYIENDVHRNPNLSRIVTWELLDVGEINLTDQLLTMLAPDWRLEKQEEFTARDHWRWMDLRVYRRRVYLRNGFETPISHPSTKTVG